MSAEIDYMIDRRNLRRKVTLWRVLSLALVAIAVLLALALAGVFDDLGTKGKHIARVSISGVITEDRKFLNLLKSIRKDENVKGVVLAIDSPGGTTVGGESTFHAIRELAEAKPTVASVGTLAASAGYMVASASDHIVARHSSIVGSIGVMIQYPQASALMEKIGVEMKEVKSSPLKAEPSPFHEAPPEAVANLQMLIDDSYNWFVDLVTDRRPMGRAEVLKVADGRVFSGKRGMDLKLVDALGGEDQAKKWLVDEKGLDKELELIDWKVAQDRNGLLFSQSLWTWLLGDSAAHLIGSDPTAGLLPKRLFLDGLLSIWQK